MSFYDTGNPVPSIDPRDLDDNAKHIDELTNSTFPTFVDRLGTTRRTLAGIEADADAIVLRDELLAPGGEAIIAMTRINAQLWGLRGDASYDNLAAFNNMIANIPATSTVWFPKGVYRFSDGIVFPLGMIPVGDGISVMGAFPTHQDDKRFLRPGYKHLIPGTAFLFTGVGTHTETTVREAPFSSIRPAVTMIGDNSPAQLHGITVIMDMDVLDAGGAVTSVSTDNRADYDVGVFLRDSCLGRFSFVSAGYWKVAGVLNYGNDPDSNTFTNGSSMGERGFVNLGTGSAGHSGTESHGWMYYANDHHKRDLTAAQWGICALMYSSTGGYNIDGLYVYGGRLNTYCDTPLILNDCSNVWFYGTVMELPDLASPGATTSKFIGNSTCDKIGFVGCRFTDDPIHGAGKLDALIDGDIIMVGGTIGFTPAAAVEVIRGGKVIRLRMPTEGPSIQLANSTTSSSAGTILRNSAADTFEIVSGGSVRASMTSAGLFAPIVNEGQKHRLQRSTLTVAAGAVTMTRSYHNIVSGTGAGVDLSTINGGTLGDILWLASGVGAEPITLKTSGGNIRIGADLILTGFTRILLVFDGTNWTKSS